MLAIRKITIPVLVLSALLASCERQKEDSPLPQPQGSGNASIETTAITDNEIFFNVTGLDDQQTCAEYAAQGQTAFRTYCWDFGDCSEPSFAANPTHIYASTGTFTVTLRMTGIYEDIDRRECEMSSTVHTLSATLTVEDLPSTPPSHSPYSQTGSTWVHVEEQATPGGPANPTGGEMMYYLVTCKNTGGYQTGSYVQVSFPTAYFITHLPFLSLSCGLSASLSHANGQSTFTIGIPSGTQEVREFYVPVLGRPGIDEPDQVTVSAYLHATSSSGTQTANDAQVSNVGKSWDPNFKSTEVLADADGTRLLVDIHFENLGSAMAREAWIVDEIPEGYDLGSLAFASASAPGLGTVEGSLPVVLASIPSTDKFDYRSAGIGQAFCGTDIVLALDPKTRRLACVIRDAALLPCGRDGKPSPDGQGHFSYSIRQQPGAALPGKAACVYLDNVNNEVLTDLPLERR